MVEDVEKVVVTEAALALLEEIRAEHGDVVFKISAGCCDGTGPMCFREADVIIGVNDVKLGDADNAGIWATPSIADLWKNSQLILDAGPGTGAGFSLDNGRTTHFLTRSRIIPLDD
ncbi:DUF779 domain-containing protein [Aliiroseovarius marinus]|uniref:DUF779 domain-containing protein n=1 Tax=Aliiroseovarius marinus TaxID=2500159 RepID=UPI002493F9E1|nr:DUF779 domain-containing protein [Aliiroseovarius marinus]